MNARESIDPYPRSCVEPADHDGLGTRKNRQCMTPRLGPGLARFSIYSQLVLIRWHDVRSVRRARRDHERKPTRVGAKRTRPRRRGNTSTSPAASAPRGKITGGSDGIVLILLQPASRRIRTRARPRTRSRGTGLAADPNARACRVGRECRKRVTRCLCRLCTLLPLGSACDPTTS
jgi:hypothetical protein